MIQHYFGAQLTDEQANPKPLTPTPTPSPSPNPTPNPSPSPSPSPNPNPNQRERVAVLLPEDQAGLRLTPAMMEQLCAEHETVETMLDELLRQMSGPVLVPSRASPSAT